MSRNYLKQIMRVLLVLVLVFLILRGHNVEILEKPSWSTAKDFAFMDITEKSGLAFQHEMFRLPPALAKIEPFVNGQSSSVSVVDINNDDYPDIYLANSILGRANKLFINQKNGTFSEQAEQYGLAQLNMRSFGFRSLFFDCNGDKLQDLLLLTNSCPRLYTRKNSKTKFEPVSLTNLSDEACSPSISAVVFDYDLDGHLDIVFSQLWGRNTYSEGLLPNSFVDANNGGKTFVLKNNGLCNFKEVSIMARQNEKLYTNAIGVGDFRGTGRKDIWFATDFHHDEIYTNENGRYVKPDKKIELVMAKSGMSVEPTYLSDTERPYVFVSHVYKKGYYPHGNTFYHFDGVTFKNQALNYKLDQCGWAWGAKFFDINNDGYQDLYVANGFFSGASKEEAKDFSFPYAVISSASSYFLKNSAFWPDMSGKRLSGHEQDCLFLNSNNHNFSKVQNDQHVEVDRLKLNGRGVASLDIRNDGSLSVIVTNQLDQVYLYETTQKNANSWIGFKLNGTQSNKDGYGAKVLITSRDGEAGVHQQVREYNPFNGYASQSESKIHFGLGRYNTEINAKIVWPSGIIQHLNNLKPGKYHLITEGQSYE